MCVLTITTHFSPSCIRYLNGIHFIFAGAEIQYACMRAIVRCACLKLSIYTHNIAHISRNECDFHFSVPWPSLEHNEIWIASEPSNRQTHFPLNLINWVSPNMARTYEWANMIRHSPKLILRTIEDEDKEEFRICAHLIELISFIHVPHSAILHASMNWSSFSSTDSSTCSTCIHFAIKCTPDDSTWHCV